jgi:uncharacterized protein YwqG
MLPMTESPLALLQAHALNALHLVSAPGGDRFSQIGGRPNLPDGMQWPEWNEKPLAFLAQVDLAELPSASSDLNLPATGCLWFFYDAEQSTWGFDPKDAGSWRVLHGPRPPDGEPNEPPAALADGGEFEAVPLAAREIKVLPSIERAVPQSQQLDASDWDAIEAVRREGFQGRPHHQIGGYPDPVQGDSMELECQLASNGLYCGDASGYSDPRAAALAKDAGAWKLLLQLDTDDDASMMWGDCGMLYFWIREDDLAKRDFSKVWMVLQCS